MPKEWTDKLVRKIKASGEVWGHLAGSIDTKEKFEARRMELATKEWKRMEAPGSRECRNCHSFDTMDAKKQGPRAQKKHAKAKEEGKPASTATRASRTCCRPSTSNSEE